MRVVHMTGDVSKTGAPIPTQNKRFTTSDK